MTPPAAPAPPAPPSGPAPAPVARQNRGGRTEPARLGHLTGGSRQAAWDDLTRWVTWLHDRYPPL
jgi:hypothetical protein